MSCRDSFVVAVLHKAAHGFACVAACQREFQNIEVI